MIETSEAVARMQRLFAAQRSAFAAASAPDLAARLASLARLRGIVLEHGKAFAAAIREDFGARSTDETSLLEVVPLLNGVRHAKAHLRGWMAAKRRPVDIAFQPAKAWVRHEPLGVVGVISPWNYPLLLSLAPLTDALAAGNRVLIKPSELTPAFSDLLRHLLVERFEEAQVAVVTGGPEVAQAFSSLPFDHLLFTGSTAVGRKVMRAAAENLTPVTLELGGKSPALVLDDYPIEKAAKSIAFGKFVNAGQTCIAPDYALVPRGKLDAFARALMAQVERAYPTVAANPDYSAMISPRHHARLAQAVEQARAAGAIVITHEDAGAAEARKLGPTVVIGAPADSLLMTEEIFGPVLPLLPYDSLEEAVGYIAARERPLALYAFSHDEAAVSRVLDGAISGGVTLNGTLLHIAQDALPFGGVGLSGMGAYHGYDGFRRFSHVRGVHKVGAINAFEMLGPPFGKPARTLAGILSRR